MVSHSLRLGGLVRLHTAPQLYLASWRRPKNTTSPSCSSKKIVTHSVQYTDELSRALSYCTVAAVANCIAKKGLYVDLLEIIMATSFRLHLICTTSHNFYASLFEFGSKFIQYFHRVILRKQRAIRFMRAIRAGGWGCRANGGKRGVAYLGSVVEDRELHFAGEGLREDRV